MSKQAIQQFATEFATSSHDFLIANSQANAYYNNDQFYYVPHRHTEYVDWIYVVEGKLHQTVNGRACTLGPGDLLWIRQGDWHEEWGDHLRFFVFCCTTTWLESTMRALQAMEAYRALLAMADPPRGRVAAERQDELALRWERCWEVRHGSLGPCHAIRLISELFLDCFCPLVENTMRQRVYPDWLRGAMLYIQSHVGETISSEQLAEVCDKSPEHVARIFRAHLGTTPSQYVNLTRLHYAARLLSTTDRPILDISMEAGFGSLSHFYRLFKKRFNRSPRTFRREHFQFRRDS